MLSTAKQQNFLLVLYRVLITDDIKICDLSVSVRLRNNQMGIREEAQT